MSFLKSIEKLFYRIFYTTWISLSKRNTSLNGKTIFIWVNINGFKGLVYYLIDADAFPKDIITYFLLTSKGYKVKIVLGKKISKIKNSNIFYNFTYLTDYIGFGDNHGVLFLILKNLKKQSNYLLPSYETALLWENKSYMYQELMGKGIKIPKTCILDFGQVIPDDIFFPFLIKEEHDRGSLGVHKIKTIKEFDELVNKSIFKKKNDKIIIQELINMRRDLRVVCIGDEIVLSFWRINPKDDWYPTSTKYGSYVDFNNFPDKWKNYIIDIHLKLGITTGGYDLVWEDDNLDNPPLVLEVSPSYQPNPPVELKTISSTYSNYKTETRLKDSFHKKFIDILYSIQKKYIDRLLKDYEI